MRNTPKWGTALAAAATLVLFAASVGAQTTQIQGVVNLNLATAEELALLPGVGPARAAAIIEHRKEAGPFESCQGLLEIRGIGEKALERMKPHCVVNGKTTAHESGS